MRRLPVRAYAPRTFRVVLGLSLGGFLGGCGLLAGLPDWRLASSEPIDGSLRDGATDTASGDEQTTDLDAGSDGVAVDGGPGCHTDDPFGPIVPIAELNTHSNDGFARLSQDETIVYFESDRLDATSKIFRAIRATRQAAFTSIGPLPETDIGGGYSEYAPTITGDTLTIYFHATDGNIPRRIYYVTRPSPSSAFGAPVPVAALAPMGYHPFIHPSGQYMFLVTGPPDGGAPFILLQGNFTTPEQASGVMPVNFPSPPTGAFLAPVVSADGKEFFGSAMGQIWHATRPASTGPFSSPQLLLELSDVVQDTFPDWLSPDGCRLYFHRTSPSNGTELFVAARPFH